MGHYAKVVNGIVEKVIVADETFFETFVDDSAGQWLQTSYNTRGNIHYGADGLPDDGFPLRANYAGIGYSYDSVNDVFISPKPYASWVLNTQTFLWESPIAKPEDGNKYYWDEQTQSWIKVSAE
jgi:hypothetical protein